MRNGPQTKLDWQLYYQWVLANQHFAFIYIDKFGFQIGTQRHFGRAPRGQTARPITPLTRSANVSVCLAVSASHGLLYHDFSPESTRYPLQRWSTERTRGQHLISIIRWSDAR
jgi:hypothetical protein